MTQQKKKGKTVLVFYTTPNHCQFETWETCNLKMLQQLIGGYIECLPHEKGNYTAYANEEGVLKQLPSNTMAQGVLCRVGFLPMPYGYYGNVIVLGKNDRSLTKTQEAELNAAITQWQKE